MSKRTAAWSTVALVLVAACGSGVGVLTERADPIPTTAEPGSAEPTEIDPPTTDPTNGDPPASDPTQPPPTSDGEPPATSIDESSDQLDWQEFGDGVEATTVTVPVDYDDPNGEQFELFVARHRADDQDAKIGSLLINPGGPGFGGSDYGLYAEQIFGEELLERFDIVGWDPRGTGLSEPAIDCIDDYDRYFAEVDITPDDDTEKQQRIDLAEEFAAECESSNGDILQHIGTNNSVRDIDSIRRALGEERISYFGFSYGSELGATWATLFPETVRAAVLDGASDPDADPVEKELQQLQGFENTLTTFLTQCSEDTTCAFHNDGESAAAFDALMSSLDENPIPTEPNRPDANLAVGLQAVVQAMYADSYWPQLAEALAAAQDGDGSGLLALHDSYYQRSADGEWGNELEAYQSISCADDVERPTVEEYDETAARLTEVAPRLAPPGTGGGYMCTFFPPSIDPRAEISGVGAGPIVVVGTTGDAATPLASTRRMAAALEDGRLVVVTADQHTGYKVNDCIDDVIHRYLVDLEVPAPETEC